MTNLSCAAFVWVLFVCIATPTSSQTASTGSSSTPPTTIPRSFNQCPQPPKLYSINTINKQLNKTVACLRMKSNILLQFSYPTSDNQENTTAILFGDAAVVDYTKSSCRLSVCAEPTSSTLVISYTHTSPYTLTLVFNETADNKHWRFASLTVNYTMNNVDFPNYRNSNLIGKSFSIQTSMSLFDWTATKVKLKTSYKCISPSVLTGFSPVNDTTHDNGVSVSVAFSCLQVQAFKFSNDVTKFDNDDSCYADNNIAYPIGVSIALILLACSVLLAMLIKYCVEKRVQSKINRYNRLSVNTL